MFKKIVENVRGKINENIEINRQYNELLSRCCEVPSLNPIGEGTSLDSTISYKEILDKCPDLNDSKAKLIRTLIPLDEVYLGIYYGKDCLSKKEYYFVFTNKYLWLINMSGYLLYNYDNLRAQVIKNNIMSKNILFGNIMFEINGETEALNLFMNLINNKEIRDGLIKKEIDKFCGIVPVSRYINDIGSGLSLDRNNMIVFHSSDFNYKTLIDDLENYELLLDDIVVREKISLRRTRLTAYKNSCSSISIRVTTKEKKIFIVPILLKNSFGSVYQATSEVFISNKRFAECLMDILDRLAE